MSRSIEDLEPVTRAKCIEFLRLAALAGQKLIIVQTLRSYEEQDLLWQRGRYNRPGPIVTRARGGWSFHCFRMAFDFAFGDPTDPKVLKWTGPWADMGKIGENLGLDWGGRWRVPDRPHLEWKDGKTIEQIRAEHPEFCHPSG